MQTMGCSITHPNAQMMLEPLKGRKGPAFTKLSLCLLLQLGVREN